MADSNNSVALATSKIEQVCQLLDVINTAAAQALSKFLRKLAVLKRLAEILEIAGDLITLPDITKFIPTLGISLEMYERMRVNCPELGLPPAGSLDELTGLTKLQDQMATAYGQIDNMLNNHPWNQAGFLQSKADALLNELVAPILDAVYPFFGIMACFKAICDAASQIATIPATVKTQMADYAKTIEGAPETFSTALSTSCQEKVTRIRTMRSDLREIAPQLNPVDYSNAGLGLE